MNNIKLSIIVTCYNDEKYISECLNSIIKNNNQNIEIIIIDDNSTDHSNSIIQRIIAGKESIKYYKLRHNGLSYARNYGISRSNGEYLMFVDGDDYLYHDAIKTIFDYLSINDPELLLVGCTKYYENENKFIVEKLNFEDITSLTDKELIKNKVFGRAWRFIYNKKYIKKHNFMFINHKIYEDENWVPKIIYYSSDIRYIDKQVYVYRKRTGSITNTKSLQNILDLIYITEHTYRLHMVKKGKKQYIMHSLMRCVRNILSSYDYLNETEYNHILKWCHQNKKMLNEILRVNNKLYLSINILGIKNGVKFYKKHFREKYCIEYIEKGELYEKEV